MFQKKTSMNQFSIYRLIFREKFNVSFGRSNNMNSHTCGVFQINYVSDYVYVDTLGNELEYAVSLWCICVGFCANTNSTKFTQEICVGISGLN